MQRLFPEVALKGHADACRVVSMTALQFGQVGTGFMLFPELLQQLQVTPQLHLGR